jgi:hypothetical protein
VLKLVLKRGEIYANGNYRNNHSKSSDAEQQRKLLRITESFLNETATETGWSALKKAIADNQINSGVGDLAKHHDHYIYGTEKK